MSESDEHIKQLVEGLAHQWELGAIPSLVVDLAQDVYKRLGEQERRIKGLEWMAGGNDIDDAVRKERDHWQIHLHNQDRIVDELHQRLRVALGLLKEIADDLDMEAPGNPGSQKAYALLEKEQYRP